MPYTYRVYYLWPEDSIINDGSKGILSDIETTNPVSVGDFVEAPIGESYVPVQMVVHEAEYSWLLVGKPTDADRKVLKEIPKY